jgi:glycosyltransferase involved in cell wall biosynthesis
MELIAAPTLPDLAAGQIPSPSLTDELLAKITIDSPLTPYLRPADYAAPRGHPPWSGGQSGILAATEVYGKDLFAEVGRYEEAVVFLAHRGEFDVIHAHDWMTIPAALRLGQISGKPVVLHIHSLETDRSGINLNQAIFAMEKRGLREADHVIAVSHYCKNRIISHYQVPEEKITVAHNALSRTELRPPRTPARPGKEKLVLFLGRITHQKGPDYFVEAAALVRAILSEVKFVMAGTGDMLPAMVEKVASLGLGNCFRFTGFLSPAEVEEIFALSDLYVMPSVSEPFGISALEAMFYDVPVIISRQSGVSELVRHALKVDFWKVEELADCIVAALKRPPLAGELAGRAREEIKSIRWANTARQIEEVYQQLLS